MSVYKWNCISVATGTCRRFSVSIIRGGEFTTALQTNMIQMSQKPGRKRKNTLFLNKWWFWGPDSLILNTWGCSSVQWWDCLATTVQILSSNLFWLWFKCRVWALAKPLHVNNDKAACCPYNFRSWKNISDIRQQASVPRPPSFLPNCKLPRARPKKTTDRDYVSPER